MGWDDLTGEERTAVLRLLRDAIENDPYPLSPRIRRLKRARDKLDPPPAETEPPPPVTRGEPSLILRRNRRRR